MERLIIMENGEENILNITTRVVTVGRSSKNDISIKDRNASRRHCNIIKVGDSWFVVDCDSQNGTYVNGKQIKKQELEDGDKVSVGAAEIVFVLTKDGHAKKEKPAAKTPEDSPVAENIKAPTPEDAKPKVEEKPPQEEVIIKESEIKETKSQESAPDLSPLEGYSEEYLSGPGDFIDSCAESESEQERKTPEGLQMQSPTQVKQSSEEKNQKFLLYYESFLKQYSSVVVGNQEAAQVLFTALLSNGHCIFTGAPGTGKHSVAKAVAQILGLSFSRVSLEKTKQITFSQVTVIQNIEHAPQETHAYLSDTIQQKQELIQKKGEKIPFLVVVNRSQNQESLYQSTFAFEIPFHFFPLEEEMKILTQINSNNKPQRDSLGFSNNFKSLQSVVKDVEMSDEMLKYTTQLIQNSRPGATSPAMVNDYVEYGAGYNAGATILRAAKVTALINKRNSVEKSDIQYVAKYILRNSISLKPSMTEDKNKIVEAILASV